MDLTDVHGIDVERLFLEWFHGEFAAWFGAEFPGKGITLVILDNRDPVEVAADWDEPLRNAQIVAHLGDEAAATGPDGTLFNVEGKLKFRLRTGENSSFAELHPELVLEGDFPHEGAGEYEGRIGGVSGLKKEEDWEVLCQCIDRLNLILRTVMGAVIGKAEMLRKQDDCPEGTKYLKGVTITQEEFDEQFASALAAA